VIIKIARIGLLVLTAFVAVTAIAGAIWVVPTMPLDWIRSGPLTDWTIPALALGFVGGLHAVAFLGLLVRPWAGALLAILGGTAMVVFELVEIGVVGWTLSDPRLPDGFQKSLQLVYLIVGSVQALLGIVLWRAEREEAPAIPVLHPSAA
jgi:hypothetical protein